ncbi:MAG TPA: SDR family oxidoreductase [Gammaproteobacteria bacterium]|nr:SDR family oxidoreductase [Gammaproteobacteria bacterium]
MDTRIIITGCGYVGKKLASECRKNDYKVIAITRTETSRRQLENEFESYDIDLDKNSDFPVEINLQHAIVFYLIPPIKTGVTDTRIVHFLDSLNTLNLPKKIILISTTGVYGDCKGEWVDETRMPEPLTERARRRLSAETSLSDWCDKREVDSVVFRVPGIYGPGNLPVRRLYEKKPVLTISDSPWSNRVHVDDLVQACIKAISYCGDQKIFNISDGNPATMTEFFIAVARRMGLPEPEQLGLDECSRRFSVNMMSYLAESKKIDNSAMIRELKVRLKYPTLVQGLQNQV